jgi:hypothetical protein
VVKKYVQGDREILGTNLTLEAAVAYRRTLEIENANQSVRFIYIIEEMRRF